MGKCKKVRCLDCQNFSFDGGSPGYSDMTPGSGLSMDCDKNHWRFDFYDHPTQEEFATILNGKRECIDFIKRKKERNNG